MIYSLRGILNTVEQNFMVIECAGVGYGLRTTMGTIGKLPRVGGEVRVYTHLSVREDAVELFGFLDKRELDCFRLLTTVSGVGPKAAIAILSELPDDKLMLAIAAGDIKALTGAPGVGPKLAGRIVLELKDKFSGDGFAAMGTDAASVTRAAGRPNTAEAVSALIALGYAPAEAAGAVSKQPDENTVQELIKGALKILGGQRL